MGSDSILAERAELVTTHRRGHVLGGTHHLDGGVGQIDELGQDFAILAGGIELGGIP